MAFYEIRSSRYGVWRGFSAAIYGFEAQYIVVVARMRLDAACSTRTQQHSGRGPQPGVRDERGLESRPGRRGIDDDTNHLLLSPAHRRSQTSSLPSRSIRLLRSQSPVLPLPPTRALSNSDPASDRSPRGQPLPFRRFPTKYACLSAVQLGASSFDVPVWCNRRTLFIDIGRTRWALHLTASDRIQKSTSHHEL